MLDGWTGACLTSLTASSPGDSPLPCTYSSASDLTFLPPSSPHFSLISAVTKPFTLTRWGCPLPSREDGLRRGWESEAFCLSAAARPPASPGRVDPRSGEPRGSAELSPATRGEDGTLAGERKGARPGGQRRRPRESRSRGGEGWVPPWTIERGCPAGSPGAVRRVCAGRELEEKGGQGSLPASRLRARLRSPAGRTALIPVPRSRSGADPTALGNCRPSAGCFCATGHSNVY